MIQIQDTLISDDLFEVHFVCDLCKCKGQCCVDGESGAPITREEFTEINEILPAIWEDLTPKAQELIKQQGIAYTDSDGELVTSIIRVKSVSLPASMPTEFASAQSTVLSEKDALPFRNLFRVIFTR